MTGFFISSVSGKELDAVYQWYECDENGNNAKKLAGQNKSSLLFKDIEITEDTQYFFAKVYMNGILVQNTYVNTILK